MKQRRRANHAPSTVGWPFFSPEKRGKNETRDILKQQKAVEKNLIRSSIQTFIKFGFSVTIAKK